MGAFLLKRAVQGIVTIFAASIVIFIVIRLIPGDPAVMYAGSDATPETIAAIREEFGLTQPIHIQYLIWLREIAHGNFGTSFVAHVPVVNLIGQRVMPTLILLVGSVIVMSVLGFALGAAAAVTRKRMLDTVLTGISSFLSGAPVFWIGLLAILLFAVYLRWLPVGGYVNPFTNPVNGLKAMAMPCIVLGIAMAGTQARFIRAAYKEVLESDYIRLAEAKGASRRRIVWKHATRNAMVPIVTVFGVAIANLLGGAVVIETVFTWPGLGLLMINSVNVNDYPTVQVILLLYVAIFVVVNFLTDVSYSLIDPRIRLTGAPA
jgi:peptide/nickel transport system permease protein